MSERICPQCGSTLPSTMRSHAVYCSRICQSRHYKTLYRDKWIEKQRLYREANRELLRQRARRHNPRYYAAHSEEMRETSRNWRKEHPELVCAYSRRRYHAERAGGPLPPESMLAVRLADQGGHCAYCHQEKPLELEHLVPVNKGGTNSIDNLLFACRSCNASKGDKSYKEWTMAAAFTLLARAAGILE